MESFNIKRCLLGEIKPSKETFLAYENQQNKLVNLLFELTDGDMFEPPKPEPQQELQLEECAICCEAIIPGKNDIKIRCGHTFHKTCLKQWVAKSPLCPNCRSPVKAATKQ